MEPFYSRRGSNSARVRAWKAGLQRLADELDLPISVCHYPPGTASGTSHEAIVNLIADTTSTTGLKIRAALDDGDYPLGVKISNDQMEALRLSRDEFHGDWNYTLSPPNIT